MRKLIASIAVMIACAIGVQAATYTNFTGSATVLPGSGMQVRGIQNTINFTTSPAVTGTVYQVFGFPSNCTVLAVSYHVTSSNTPVDLSTFDIGDLASRTQYKTGGTMATLGTTQASVTGKCYTSNDVGVVTSYGTITNGVLTIWALVAGVPSL